MWDAFKAQSTPKVIGTLSSYGIESIMASKNMTHLLRPLDLTTNVSLKKLEKQAFSEFFTSRIMEALDVATIKVDLLLSTLKPRHAKVMTGMYQHLKSEKGKEIIKAGWRASVITDILKDAQEGNRITIRLNPFV